MPRARHTVLTAALLALLLPGAPTQAAPLVRTSPNPSTSTASQTVGSPTASPMGTDEQEAMTLDFRVVVELGDPGINGAAARQIRSQTQADLLARGFNLDDPSQHHLSVTVTWADEHRAAYLVDLVYGSPAGRTTSLGTDTCVACDSATLLEHITTLVGRHAPALAALCAADRPSASPMTTQGSPALAEAPSNAPARPRDDAPPPRRPLGRRAQNRDRGPLGPMGIAGATLVGVGATSALAGIALLAVPVRETTDGIDLHRRDYRVPGGLLTGLGLAAVAVGAPLLGLAQRRRKSSRQTAWAPVFGRGTVGVTVRARL